MNFVNEYLTETIDILSSLDRPAIDRLAYALAYLRQNKGRLFILGVGGSAAHASHAVNDFRKICNIEAYAPTDNVAELTARVNDEDWGTFFEKWLAGSNLNYKDAILVFSVGGGNLDKGISTSIVNAVNYANWCKSKIYGIVGRDGGHTAKKAHICVTIPPKWPERVTPHTEGICAIIWHLIVSHPVLKVNQTKWENNVS